MVNSRPVVSFSGDVTTGCAPLCVNFLNTTSGVQSQAWNFGDGDSSLAQDPIHCYKQAGSYHVVLTVTDNNGCTNALVKNNYITVYPIPVAAFNVTPNPAKINNAVNFIDKSIGASQWQWSFGDVAKSSSSLQSPSYIYDDSKLYNIELIVSNEFGCRDTAYNTLFVQTEFALFAPNTFTPNNDGVNDIFIPLGFAIDATSYDLFIFDRWGNKIFYSNNPLVGWDGRANGGKEIAQEDVYVWKVKVKDIYANNYNYTGHINLVR
jgi:gliding motility-associated-like protein